jgi:hypothetical protein
VYIGCTLGDEIPESERVAVGFFLAFGMRSDGIVDEEEKYFLEARASKSPRCEEREERKNVRP